MLPSWVLCFMRFQYSIIMYLERLSILLTSPHLMMFVDLPPKKLNGLYKPSQLLFLPALIIWIVIVRLKLRTVSVQS